MPTRSHLAIVLLSAALLLGACNGNEPSVEGLQLTAEAIAETMVSARISATSRASLPTATSTPEAPTHTPTPSGPTPTPMEDGPCLAVSLSDETVPDDTVIQPGEAFEKGWVLTNVGGCTWTEDYDLVFHHGNDMAAVHVTPLAGWVTPGQSVTLTLDMVAPTEAGSHIGFWSLRSPDGGIFGPSANGTFWVRVTVPGAAPTSQGRSFGWSGAGAAASSGELDSQALIGDDTGNDGWQGFLTFAFGNLSDEATVTGVALYITDDYIYASDPFGSLGCLNVYLSFHGAVDAGDYDNYSGSPLWRFCSLADLTGAAVYGDSNAVTAVQNALPSGVIQFSFVFDNATDSDGIQDHIIVDPFLAVSYYE
jgi:hypothetical protein